MKMVGSWLFLLISLQGYEAPSTPNVNCLIINLDYVNCTWSEQGSPEVNYTFFHKRLLYPPVNLSVEMNKDPELNLYWNNSKNTYCIESEVRYRINSDKWKTSTPSKERKYAVAFPLKSSRYEFQVRARTNNECGESKFWCEWSQPIQWDSMKGNNFTDISGSSMSVWKPVLSLVGTMTLFILACMLVYRERERLRFILIPIVPNPGKNLEDLLDKDTVAAWLHISEGVCFQPNFTEIACPVREYSLVPQTGSVSESVSNLSIPTDQSDFLSMCSSSASTFPATSENEQAGIE
ncbi:cytokine receptor common subunit gamma-like [Salvelinus alpinus]